MADRQDSDAAASTPPPEWLASEWSTLCDILGTSDPEEVVPRVRTLKDNMDRIDERSTPDESFVTISEVEEVFREMHDRLQKLRERNAQLVDQLEGQDEEGVETAFKELHRETEELLEVLGVTSVDEGKQRVRSMNRQLESLYHEKETLVEAGYTSAAEALEEIDEIREKQSDAASTGPDTSVFHAASAIRNVIGVATIGEAEELVASVRELHDRLSDLAAQNEAVAEATGIDNPEDLAAMVTSMDAQLRELYRERERATSTAIPQEVSDMLGVKSTDDARRLAEMVQSLGNRVQAYRQERERISEQTGLQNADGVLEMISSMEEQLIDLYEHQQSALPQEVGEILGVYDEDEARQLESTVRSMGERLRTYQSDHNRLTDQTGVQSADGVLDMISSMEEQLVDLYDQASKGLSGEASEILGVSTDDEARELADAVRSISDRLRQLQSEHERIAENIGVKDADGVLNMIRSMEEQLVDLYSFAQDALPPEVGEVLGVRTEDEARALKDAVTSMGERLSRYRAERDRISEQMGVKDADGVLSMIDSMEEQLVDLYETMDQHVAEVESEANRAARNGEAASEIGRVLGVESVGEAEELAGLVQDMTNQLERLTLEQEKLDGAGLTAEQAVAMIDTMEEQLVDLYQDRSAEVVSRERDDDSAADASVQDDFGGARNGPSGNGAPGDSSTDRLVEETENEVLETLGVKTPEEARELANLVRSMSDQLERLTNDQERLVDAGLTVDSALQMIDGMEEQLVDLYEDREVDREVVDEYETVQSVLGVSTPDEARELADLVTALHDQMTQIRNEQSEMLEETGMSSPRDVLAMVRSMEEQLVDLYQEREASGDAMEQLNAIEDELGIRTADDAREIADMARSMNERISELEDQQSTLQEVGVQSAADAAMLIESMSEQLEELYQEREATTLRASALEEGQDTFQQLEALYAERERLERELGLASADDIIEMVEGLATQLDDLYGDRETGEEVSGDVQNLIREHASEEDAEMMLASMEQQLRDLYGEKERLLEMGYGNADEAAEHIQSLESKRADLARSAAQCRERFERLERELGVSGVEGVLGLVKDLKSSGDGSRTTPTPPSPSQRPPQKEQTSASSQAMTEEEHPGFFIDAAPAFVPDDVLSRLEQLNSQQMDDLSFGVVRLDDTGTVEFVNEAGLSLPGLKKHDNKTTIVGKNFFFDLAPSTNNNLFFGRFKQGLNQGAMDARFPYTFISPGQGPTVLIVHLHSKPNSNAQWLLFRAM